jgi:phospho-N-acetylmuramoyl-pentapeptide-transferase
VSDTLRLRSIDATIDLGVFYPLLIYLVVAGTTSAVNLTDGLDGLAGGCAAIVLLAYIGITFITGGQRDLALLCGCLVGACVGFCGSTPSRPRSSWATPGRSGWAGRSPAWR